MVNIRELPLIFMMLFTLIYSTLGDPNSPVWSGAYFLVNYATLLVLFKSHRSKKIRIIGMSLSVSIIIFIALKYFFNFNYERIYTIIPFTICLIGLIIIDAKNEPTRRKNL